MLDLDHSMWHDLTAATLQTLQEWTPMDAVSINRKVKELDALEKRIRQTVNPSSVLLAQIKKERDELLNPKPEATK